MQFWNFDPEKLVNWILSIPENQGKNILTQDAYNWVKRKIEEQKKAHLERTGQAA